MKWISWVFLLCICCFNAQAKVRIGVPLFVPPFAVSYKISGPQGFDINLMNEICHRLQWDCEYMPMRYYELFTALQDNTIDLAIGALIITMERKQNYIFSIPYLISDAGYILLSSSKINSVTDLAGKRVGALMGREYYNYLETNFFGQFTIVPFEEDEDIILALTSGKIDAIFMNYNSALYIQHDHQDRIKVLKTAYNLGDGLGIAALPNNQANIDLINNELLQIQSDGTFIKLYNYTFQFLIQQ